MGPSEWRRRQSFLGAILPLSGASEEGLLVFFAVALANRHAVEPHRASDEKPFSRVPACIRASPPEQRLARTSEFGSFLLVKDVLLNFFQLSSRRASTCCMNESSSVLGAAGCWAKTHEGGMRHPTATSRTASRRIQPSVTLTVKRRFSAAAVPSAGQRRNELASGRAANQNLQASLPRFRPLGAHHKERARSLVPRRLRGEICPCVPVCPERRRKRAIELSGLDSNEYGLAF